LSGQAARNSEFRPVHIQSSDKRSLVRLMTWHHTWC
jgi:hypothetical protein